MTDGPKAGEQEHECIEVVVQPDGRVLFRVLNDEMLDVAQQVAPRSPEVRRRVAMRRRARRRGAHEGLADS